MTTNSNFRIKNGLEFPDSTVMTSAPDQSLNTGDSVAFNNVAAPAFATSGDANAQNVIYTSSGLTGENIVLQTDTGDGNIELIRGATGGGALIFSDGSRQDVAAVTDQELKTTSLVEFGTVTVTSEEIVTPATGDPLGQYVTALTYAENTDPNSLFNFFIVEGDASTSTSQVKYGNSSFAFNGVGYIDIDSEDDPSTAFNLKNNDFAIDFWVYPTDGETADQVIAERASSGRSQWRITSLGSDLYIAYLYEFNYTPSIEFTLTADQWNHVCVNRYDGNYAVYVDGVLANTAPVDENNRGLKSVTSGIKLGNTVDPDLEGFTGYIDNFRLTIGNYRWNADFTPPAESEYAFTLAVTTATSLAVTSAGITFADATVQTTAYTGGGGGAQGPQGYQGDAGSQGSQGYQGAAGAQGYQGDAGSQGSQGGAGAQGAPGASGAEETIYAIGTTSGSITPSFTNGTVQTITLNGNLTLNGFTGSAGQSLTLIITQDATGARTLSSTMKFAGASKVLSLSPLAVDFITIFYDGSTYWASLNKGFA